MSLPTARSRSRQHRAEAFAWTIRLPDGTPTPAVLAGICPGNGTEPAACPESLPSSLSPRPKRPGRALAAA